MPIAQTAASQLRDRAATLRRTAKRIDDADANLLFRRAGTDTWLGPTPQRCFDDLVAMRTQLKGAADDLRTRASRLEQQASQLDAAAIAAATQGFVR